MKTLQEHYKAIQNGQGNKNQFLKQARYLFPEYFNQYTDFNTAVNVLKSKQIINEAAGGVVSKGFDIWDWKKILAEETEDYKKKLQQAVEFYKNNLSMGTKAVAEKFGVEEADIMKQMGQTPGGLFESTKAVEKETSKEVKDYRKNTYDNTDMKNADNVNFNEIMKGFYCELKDEKNAGKTGDELKEIVVKNLAKDPLYYTKNGEFGVKGVGYTTEAPGLGEPKAPKGKHKSSGYGDLKESVMYGDSDGDRDFDIKQTIQANEYYDKGLEAYSEGDMLKAEKYYQAALKAGSWLGWTEQDLPPYNTLQENTKAEKWDKLSDDEKLNKLLSVYKDPDDAEKHIHKSWDKLPDLATVNIKLGESLEEQKLRSLIRNIIKEELNKEDYKTDKEELNIEDYKTKLRKLERPHTKDKKALEDIIDIYKSQIQGLDSIKKNIKD